MDGDGSVQTDSSANTGISYPRATNSAPKRREKLQRRKERKKRKTKRQSKRQLKKRGRLYPLKV